MAPEAVGGESLNAAADLWSLGVVLFECLTGERPFKGLEREPRDGDWARRIRAQVPDCPPHLSGLVADLLAHDKRKRPSSARAIRIRIEESARLGAA
jgi:serine/threonine protein kinase